MKYQVKKTLVGTYQVKFECPNCSISLNESLNKAGQKDSCPECGASFVLPGQKELNDLKIIAEARQTQKQLQKQQAEERKQEKLRIQKEKEEAAKLARDQKMREQAEQAIDAQRQRESLESELSKLAPYDYHCVQFNAISQSTDWGQWLQELINKETKNGWEFVNIDTFESVVPAGCLGSLFGACLLYTSDAADE